MVASLGSFFSFFFYFFLPRFDVFNLKFSQHCIEWRKHIKGKLSLKKIIYSSYLLVEQKHLRLMAKQKVATATSCNVEYKLT